MIGGERPPIETPRVAVLTGEGRGAVAVVGVWGEGAIRVVDALFRSHRGRALSAGRAGRPRLGRFRCGRGDEVVAVRREGVPELVEIHGHGGAAAVADILEGLVEAGCRPSPASDTPATGPGHWAREALSLARRASTLRAAQILLDQADGALDRELAEIDALDPAGPEAERRVRALAGRSPVGLRLVEGWVVALTGRPNAGKSLLLNALVGFGRSIVSANEGTTRDVVRARSAVDGWPVEFLDSAGVREGGDPLEAEGIDRARDVARRSDLVILVLDRSRPIAAGDRELLADHAGALVVANKVDLPAAWDESDLAAIEVSAARGDGMRDLLAAIGDRIVPDPPPPGSAVPFDRRLATDLHTLVERRPG